jgi:hypothetical protein
MMDDPLDISTNLGQACEQLCTDYEQLAMSLMANVLNQTRTHQEKGKKTWKA